MLLREGVQILFQVCVAVTVEVFTGIRGVVRVETFLLLPLVGHAIMVGIGKGCPSRQQRIAAHLGW